jgi:hypothetical protein
MELDPQPQKLILVVADGLSREEEGSASIRVVIRHIRMKQLPLQCSGSPARGPVG